MRRFYFIIYIFITVCTVRAQKIDIQGHRGARGMMPENTIPAFIYALDQGVSTLEMDVVITKDEQVVVSHDAWISPGICLNIDSTKIKDKDQFNIYKMTYSQVQEFDCGTLSNTRFPEQQKISVNKPLLSDVIKAVEMHIKNSTQYEVDYNVEIKSTPKGDNKFHPAPEKYSDIVYKLIDQYLPWDRVIIQSFDFRALKYWHEKYPKVRLSALIENTRSVDTNLANLGFKPAIYSPDYKLLTEGDVKSLHQLAIKVVPWTVNDENDFKGLLKWKVDGLITDYPNRAREMGLTIELDQK